MMLWEPVSLPDIGHCILILGAGPLMVVDAGCAFASLPLLEIAIAFATLAVVGSIKLGKCGSRIIAEASLAPLALQHRGARRGAFWRTISLMFMPFRQLLEPQSPAGVLTESIDRRG